MFCISLQYIFKVKDEISIVTIYKVSTFSVLVLLPDGGWILKPKISPGKRLQVAACVWLTTEQTYFCDSVLQQLGHSTSNNTTVKHNNIYWLSGTCFGPQLPKSGLIFLLFFIFTFYTLLPNIHFYRQPDGGFLAEICSLFLTEYYHKIK